MKLIITQSNLTLFGGGEKVVLKVAQRYDAKIYTAEYNKETTFPGFKNLDIEVVGKTGITRALPYGRVAQGLNYGLAFYNLKIKEDYDVINPHMAPSHWIRNNNKRVLWYCHTPLRDVWDLYDYRLKLKKPYQRPVYRLGAKVVRGIDRRVVKDIEFIFANSANTRSRLVKYFGRTDARVLNGGIDYERYRNAGDHRYFFYPSRISPNKQQHIAIDAFVHFKKLMGKKGGAYRLVLCGSVSKDRFFSDYYNKIAKLARSAEGVEIIGSVSDRKLTELYSKCTAVLYPPVNEDYGLVPLEAMASGKPIIASDEGGPRETVVDGRTGFLVRGPEAMADKMRYVAEDSGASEAMGREGMKRIRNHYTWGNFFDVFDKQLRKVAKA